MSWLPDLSNVSQRVPNKGLLKKAMIRLGLSFPRGKLSDSHGTYAYRFGHLLLVAKDYVYGDIVSVHKQAVAVAIEYHIPIWMYMGDGKTYEFDPEEIMRSTTRADENSKGSALMLNFSIKLGKRVSSV